MNLDKLKAWKRWLIHSFLLWFIGNTVNFSNFLYKRSLWSDYLHYSDGSPVTVLERFTDIFTLNGTQNLLVAVLFIELNYYFFFERKKWIFVVSSLATWLVIVFFLVITNVLKHGSVAYHLPSTFIIAAYAFTYPYLIGYIDQKVFKAQRSLEKSTAELSALKAQINPHFFFNTLNGIYGIAIKEEARDTAVAIEKLSGMMRYVLTEGSGDFVPVASELKFVSE